LWNNAVTEKFADLKGSFIKSIDIGLSFDCILVDAESNKVEDILNYR